MVATARQIEQARQLAEQQEAARAKALAAAIALAVAATRDFDRWYTTAAITAWAARLVFGVEGIQRSLARQTDVFLAREASLLSGRTVRPAGAVDVSALRRGITHAGAYGRIADTFRYQQSQVDAGRQVQTATEAALERAEEIVELDLQLVLRAQTEAFVEAQPPAVVTDEASAEAAAAGPPPARPRLLGWRRIVHPELSKSGSCGLCIVASTRLYTKGEPHEIHARCNCLPMLVYEGADPGGIINLQDLERFYREAGANRRNELKNTRYQVDQHGELGPVLSRSGASFRTPDDVQRDEQR